MSNYIPLSLPIYLEDERRLGPVSVYQKACRTQSPDHAQTRPEAA